MVKGILHTHYLVVVLFLLIYVIKTVLLLSNKNDLLENFTKKIKIPEMIISFLFLATGVFLLTQLSFGGQYDYLLWIKITMVFASIPLAIIGFKKKNKLLASLSLLLLTASFGLAESYHKKKGLADNSHIASNDGKALYENNCNLCHGADGKLGAAGAKDLGATVLDVAAIKDIILNGKGMMAKTAVNEEQAAAIAEYVHSNIKGH